MNYYCHHCEAAVEGQHSPNLLTLDNICADCGHDVCEVACLECNAAPATCDDQCAACMAEEFKTERADERENWSLTMGDWRQYPEMAALLDGVAA